MPHSLTGQRSSRQGFNRLVFLYATLSYMLTHAPHHHHNKYSLHKSSPGEAMGGREDGGGSNGDGDGKKMKRSWSGSEEHEGTSGTKSSAHKKKEGKQHSRTDGRKMYVCINAFLVPW